MERKLAIVVGHTKLAQGATAVPPLCRTEYIYNIGLAAALFKLAPLKGCSLRTFYRDNVGIKGCYELVASWNPAACIELHFNSVSNREVRGTETLCGLRNAQSLEFARVVHARLLACLKREPSQDRGIKALHREERGGENVNMLATVPQVLVEPFFGSNTKDAIIGSEKQLAISEALIDAFNHYLNLQEEEK